MDRALKTGLPLRTLLPWFRRAGATLLVIFGVGAIALAISELLSGDELVLALTRIPLGLGIGVAGRLLWRGGEARRIGASLLMGMGASMLLTGLDEMLAGRLSPLLLLMGALRLGFPMTICGWLLWRGPASVRMVAICVLGFAASAAIHVVTGARDLHALLILLIRGPVAGFVCAWLLWRGCELRQLAAVLLLTWPASYLIYALERSNWDSAMGELTMSIPTMLVGWLLWRERGSPAVSAALPATSAAEFTTTGETAGAMPAAACESASGRHAARHQGPVE